MNINIIEIVAPLVYCHNNSNKLLNLPLYDNLKTTPRLVLTIHRKSAILY